MAKLREKIVKILKTHGKSGLSLTEICKRGRIPRSERSRVSAELEQLKSGAYITEKSGKFSISGTYGLIACEIVKVNETFGFARQKEGGRDVFIPGKRLLGAMPGDSVLVKTHVGSGELPEGEVVSITATLDKSFTGVLIYDDGILCVQPDKYVKFPLRLAQSPAFSDKIGDKVLCELVRRGKRHSEHVAAVISNFGSAQSAKVCCESILMANDIPLEFSPEALEQAAAISAGNGIHPRELEARLDLRGEIIFTIDGADTKDIDDAISLKQTSNGYELGVHIADVSHYVTFKTPIDNEAFIRGTSVYFADSVVPMLPKELSNGICSLNEGEDRLAFSAIINLDHNAKIEDFRFVKTVIRSRLKGVYSEINDVLNASDDPCVRLKYAGLAVVLSDMLSLSKKLTQNRFNRGGINLSSVEGKVIVGSDGTAENVVPRETGDAEAMIEEFMLVANECAARLAIKEGLPFIYRVHESPMSDKLDILFETLKMLDPVFTRPKGKVGRDELRRVLSQSEGTKLEDVVNSMVLRSMAKAKYSEDNLGHFGLGLDNYTHFTSPIRRYPDLAIHRILSAFVTGMRRDNLQKRFSSFAPEAAFRSTVREIAAVTAERDCEAAYKAEYMRKHLGEEFDAIISSVTHFGCYIKLDNTVDGLVKISSLPEGDWRFDGFISLTETVSGAKLRLGDKLRVKVMAADVSSGLVDFEAVSINEQLR